VDGTVHAPDPDQRLGRHAAVAGDRAGRDPMAVAEAAGAARRRRWRWRRDAPRGGPGRGPPAPAVRTRDAALPGCRARRPPPRVALLAVFYMVVVKMLPFNNTSELQAGVILPAGRTLEDTNALLVELAAAVDEVPGVLDYQGYAGTAAPINFNGLVRQYFLRSGGDVGDLQVNLVDKHQRERQNHDIARAPSPVVSTICMSYGASVKVVEVPPGPPVLAPLVAEVYGPDYGRSRELAKALEQRFLATEGVVDVDTSVESDAPRETIVVDRVRAARLGVPQAAIADALSAAVAGLDATFVHDGTSKYPRPVRLRLPAGEQASLQRLLALEVRGGEGQLVPLSELVEVRRDAWDGAIHHKDLLPVVYVTGDEAGRLDS